MTSASFQSLSNQRYCFHQAVRNIDDDIIMKAFDESLVDTEDHEGLPNEEDNLCKKRERSIKRHGKLLTDHQAVPDMSSLTAQNDRNLTRRAVQSIIRRCKVTLRRRKCRNSVVTL